MSPYKVTWSPQVFSSSHVARPDVVPSHSAMKPGLGAVRWAESESEDATVKTPVVVIIGGGDAAPMLLT